MPPSWSPGASSRTAAPSPSAAATASCSPPSAISASLGGGRDLRIGSLRLLGGGGGCEGRTRIGDGGAPLLEMQC